MDAIRHLLVHLNDPTLSREALHLGALLARQQGAVLSALVAVDPVAGGGFLNAETASLAARLEREHLASHRQAAQALADDVAQQTGVAVELEVAASAPLEALIQASRSTDLLVVCQRQPGQAAGLEAGAAARLLTAAGCPLLFVPHVGWRGTVATPAAVAQRVLVAWSDTREVARALRDALPLLQRAARVELVSFVHGDSVPDRAPPALQAVARHLALHGVDAVLTLRHAREPTLTQRLRRTRVPDVSVAEALLSHAADTQADLLVMGGYGHPRAWELVLGGVTRTLLQTMTLPVLMSH